MGKSIEHFSETVCKKVDEKNRHTKTKANAKWILRNVRLKKAELEEVSAVLS